MPHPDPQNPNPKPITAKISPYHDVRRQDVSAVPHAQAGRRRCRRWYHYRRTLVSPVLEGKLDQCPKCSPTRVEFRTNLGKGYRVRLGVHRSRSSSFRFLRGCFMFSCRFGNALNRGRDVSRYEYARGGRRRAMPPSCFSGRRGKAPVFFLLEFDFFPSFCSSNKFNVNNHTTTNKFLWRCCLVFVD